MAHMGWQPARTRATNFTHDIGTHRTFLRGKAVAYMSHTMVAIKADPVPVLRRLGTPQEAGVPKRRHKVRGTWCHRLTGDRALRKGCTHDWVPDPEFEAVDDPNERDHWLCQSCGGARWRRHAHMRGDASIGYVEKGYRLTV